MKKLVQKQLWANRLYLRMENMYFHVNDDGLHCIDGPAFSWRKVPQWWSFGVPHNPDGKAISRAAGKGGNIYSQDYYLHGIIIDDFKYFEITKDPEPLSVAARFLQYMKSKGHENIDDSTRQHIRKTLRHHKVPQWKISALVDLAGFA